MAVNITITANSGAIENITTILSGAITDGAIQQALQQNGLSVTNVQNITVNVITAPAAPAPGAVPGHPPSHSSGVTSGAIAGITAGAAVAVREPRCTCHHASEQGSSPDACQLPACWDARAPGCACSCCEGSRLLPELMADLEWPYSARLSCCMCAVIAALLAYRWHMQRHMPEGAMKLPDMGNDGKAASDTSEAPDIMQQFRQKV